jgi:outer membrane protein assembly factor BamA
VLGAVTELGQYVVALRPSWYLQQDAVHLVGSLEVSRFPDYFYGIGNGAPASAKEPYTPLYLLADLGPLFRVAPRLYLGPSLRVQHATMQWVAPGGQLASGAVTGGAGGTTVQLGASAEWDTRDSTLCPRGGELLRVDLRRADPGLGSDFEFGLLRLDARSYNRIGASGHVLALQAVLELRNGEPPFYDTGKLGGGELMRGWYSGRYRDRQLWSAQAEYRLPLFWRLGAVAFGSAGAVGRDGRDLTDAVRLAGGGGLRVAPLARVPVNLRLDVAYGNETSVYFGLGEAF